MDKCKLKNDNKIKIIEFIGILILDIFLISVITFNHWDSNDGFVRDSLCAIIGYISSALIGKGTQITKKVRKPKEKACPPKI